MKSFTVLFLVLFLSLLSCRSKSGHRAEELKRQKALTQKHAIQHKNDSIASVKEAETHFKDELILSGIIYLEGKDGGETSPRIEFGVSKNSDYCISLILMKSSNVPGSPDEVGIPIDIAMKVKRIVQNQSQKNNFSFLTDNNGYVYYGFWVVDRSKDNFNDDSLEQSLKLIHAIEKETGWKFVTGRWRVS